MTVITPYYTFPSVGWWVLAMRAGHVLFEVHERYRKMSDRNRYRVSGPNNTILLTVPLLHGREQRVPIADVEIADDTRWQIQHWRTLVSSYNRSPYFFHYQPGLEVLFGRRFERLIDFNRAAMAWVNGQLGAGLFFHETELFIDHYPEGVIDLRRGGDLPLPEGRYHQVFEERLGFMAGLSILDLLFAEGPASGAWLRREVIKG